MGPTYNFEKLVTIGDTNAMQNLYFADYFRLQGAVRESWVKDCIPNALNYFAQGFVLSTKSAHCEYRKPFFLFDKILCCMHIEELGLVRAKLVFEFYNKDTMTLNAFGWQLVVFKDANRKTCRMPDEFREASKTILWPSELKSKNL